MDTLALLCNLYGDGPQTLRRLREAGCGTLAALDSLESERLASLLRTSVRSAQRFQNEGRLLRERTEPSAERPPAREAAEPVKPADPLVADVLTAWRERDAQAVGASTAPARVAPERVPARRVASAGGGLAELDGADAVLLERLSEAGIETPEELRDADVLDLAGRGVGGYTRLLHLQFLARRASEVVAAEVAEPPTEAAPEPLVEAATDVLLPARPPERRGAVGATAPAPQVEALRFSPREAPAGGEPGTLEEELRRFAARAEEAHGADRDPAQLEDAGSSGPFA